MNRHWGSLGLVIAAAVGLIAVHEWAPRGLYSFDGHAHLVHQLMVGLLMLLFLTHGFLAVVMWTQRGKWDAAEAGTFLFISAKALFWADFALTLREAPGISLTITYLFVVILVSTINLDVQLVRRYVLRPDEPEGVPS